MKAYINRHLFENLSIDSGALTQLCFIAHRFPVSGEYTGSVLLNDETVARFQLSVDESFPSVTQVNIDLAKLSRSFSTDCNCMSTNTVTRFELNPKTYALFYVSSGGGGFAVRVGGVKDEQGTFDSRELKEQDSFSLGLLRPGTYSLTNTINGSKGKVVVSYPDVNKGERHHRAAPVQIKCTKTGFSPKEITVQAAQGQNYIIETPSRIKLELTKPDEGPRRSPLPKGFHWEKLEAKRVEPTFAKAGTAKKQKKDRAE
jgi:hypothetical protein